MLNRRSPVIALFALLVAFASGAAAMHAVEADEPVARRPLPSEDGVARAAAKPAPYHLPAITGGWPVSELCKVLTSVTGRPILIDGVSAAVLRTTIANNVEIELPAPRFFAWVQAALAAKHLALIPSGPCCSNGERTWQLVEQACGRMIDCAVHIDDSEVLDYADRDGLYVTTTLRVPDGVDTTQMRNALSPLSTQYAGLGRIQDVPDGRSLVICDFAPIVASMKRAVDAVGANSQQRDPPPRKAMPSID